MNLKLLLDFTSLVAPNEMRKPIFLYYIAKYLFILYVLTINKLIKIETKTYKKLIQNSYPIFGRRWATRNDANSVTQKNRHNYKLWFKFPEISSFYFWYSLWVKACTKLVLKMFKIHRKSESKVSSSKIFKTD